MNLLDNFFELIFRGIVPTPEKGLNLQLFRFSSYIVPMINIELLVTNELNQVALTWRKETKDVPISGWHIPGGIIRVNETLDLRIKKTAQNELGINCITNWKVLGIAETRIPLKIPRRHFISILVHTRVNTDDLSQKSKSHFKNKIPGILIPNHQRYNSTIQQIIKGESVDDFTYFQEDPEFVELFLR